MWIAHLNKEWNEQRMPLGVLAATLLIVALGFGTLAPASVIPADLEVWFVIVALSGGLLILASDLVTGEHRRGQFGFLLRTPRALRFAFAAKFTALMLGIVALFAIGLGIGTLCEWLVAQRDIVSKVDSLGFAPRVMLAVGLAVAICAPWAFAVSTWMLRGSAVLPATAFTLAVIAAPVLLIVAGWDVPVSTTAIVTALIWTLIGGTFAAWLSFTRGLRFGPRWTTVGCTLLAAGAFVAPIHGWCADRLWAFYHADPQDADMRIHEVHLGVGGTHAFIDLARNWGNRGSGIRPRFVCMVNFETGAWTQIAGPHASLCGIGSLTTGAEFVTGLQGPQPLLGINHTSKDGQELVRKSVLDGKSGAILENDASRPLPDHLRELAREAARITTPFAMPDGSRAWLEGRTVQFDRSDDGSQSNLQRPDDTTLCLGAGFGFVEAHRDGLAQRQVVDLARRRVVTIPEHFSIRPWVRPGWWIVEPIHEDSYGRRMPGSLELWNPETDERRPLGLGEDESFHVLAGDARLLLTTSDGDGVIYDPETGSRQPLRWSDTRFDGMEVESFRSADWRMHKTPVRAPNGGSVHMVTLLNKTTGERQSAYVRLDGDLLTATRCAADLLRYTALPDENHVLVYSPTRIERWTFGSDDAEVLFEVGSNARR